MFTWFCSKFIRETIHQISSKSPKFCRRYYTKHFGLFLSQRQCRFDCYYNAYWCRHYIVTNTEMCSVLLFEDTRVLKCISAKCPNSPYITFFSQIWCNATKVQLFKQNYATSTTSGAGTIQALSERPTGFLQCFDTVGLVIWPVKIVPDMIYNVFGGMLNLAQSINVMPHVQLFKHMYSSSNKIMLQAPPGEWMYR